MEKYHYFFFFNIHQRKTQFENAVYDDCVCMCVCKNGLPCNLGLCAVLICWLSVHGKPVQTANAVFMPWLKLSPPPVPYVRWTPGLITALSASTCTQTLGSGWAFWLAASLGRLPWFLPGNLPTSVYFRVSQGWFMFLKYNSGFLKLML